MQLPKIETATNHPKLRLYGSRLIDSNPFESLNQEYVKRPPPPVLYILTYILNFSTLIYNYL